MNVKVIFVITTILLLFAFAVLLAVGKRIQACEDKGGIWLDRTNVCLKKDAVLQ